MDHIKAFVWIMTNWKFLKEMETPDHLTRLRRNLYAGQEAAVRTGHEQWTGSKLGKEDFKAVYCPTAYLSSMQSTSWEMLSWMNQAYGRNINNLRDVDDTTLKAES